jgi:RNA polymerase sigma-70 factor (ECF subfamily)
VRLVLVEGLLPDLVRRAQRGDMDAYEELVTAQSLSVYRLARAYVGDAGAADLAQDVFVAAWRGLPGLRDTAAFGPWLHRIAVNRCRSAVRGSGRVREIPMDDVTIDRAADARDGFLAAEARAVVGPAFRRLGEEPRALIALHYAAGLSIRECAGVLEIPEGTAKSRLNAALAALREDIGRTEP